MPSFPLESWKKFLPYFIFIEADGRPNYNIKHLLYSLSIVALLIVGGTYCLLAIRGCPGLSYLNVTEGKMPLCNVSLSNLALDIDKDAPKWLVYLLRRMC